MIVATLLPRFPLLVALLAARRPLAAPVALGPPPGAPQVVGLCTPAAEAAGVRPGLRVGEALARCPGLDLVVADPDAADQAAERVTRRLEDLGAGVEVVAPGLWCFSARGLERLYGGLDGVIRRTRSALPVGADGRVGAACGRFTALQAAREAPPRRPLVVPRGDEAAFLAPLPVDRLPLGHRAVAALQALGIHTMGRLAALPPAAALDRLGPEGAHARRLARGEDPDPPRPRRPPEPLEAAIAFPEPVGALPALEAAARLLLVRLAGAAGGRGRSLRAVTLRARLADGGSWTRAITLREATTDADRLAVATLPALAAVSAPVTTLLIEADAGGPPGGGQLALVQAPGAERRRRAREAIGQVRASQGPDAMLRLVELEPWSRLLERRWALVPDEG